MRILLVEDEDRIASFIAKGLTAEGHTVERAATAAEGVALGMGYAMSRLRELGFDPPEIRLLGPGSS